MCLLFQCFQCNLLVAMAWSIAHRFEQCMCRMALIRARARHVRRYRQRSAVKLEAPHLAKPGINLFIHCKLWWGSEVRNRRSLRVDLHWEAARRVANAHPILKFSACSSSSQRSVSVDVWDYSTKAQLVPKGGKDMNHSIISLEWRENSCTIARC